MVNYILTTTENCQKINIKGKGLIELNQGQAVLDLNNNEVKELREIGKEYNFKIEVLKEKKFVEKPEPEKEAEKSEKSE